MKKSQNSSYNKVKMTVFVHSCNKLNGTPIFGRPKMGTPGTKVQTRRPKMGALSENLTGQTLKI